MVRIGIAVSLAIAFGVPHSARAQDQPPSSDAARDATLHFQRGLSLADDTNYVAAMIEFQYAYRLTSNPLVLYNIAVAYAAMGQYVDALDSMRRYETLAGASLTAARRRDVEASIARYEDRIALIAVTLTHRDLEVSIDGVDYAAVQARQGIRVAVGRHDVLLRAPGFQPREEHLDVVSGSTVRLERPLDPVLSSITVDSNVADAAVLIDGQEAGRTPLNGPLPVPTGTHEVTVQRAGYHSVTSTVRAIGPGASVHAQLEWLESLPPADAGRIRVRTRPIQARLLLDGHEIGTRAVVMAPSGHHVLVADNRDYLTVTAPVALEPGRVRDLDVWLTPTPQYVSAVRGRRTSAIRVTAIGATMLFVNAVATVVILAITNPTPGVPTTVPGVVFAVTAPSAATGLAMAISGIVQYFRQPVVERLVRPANVPAAQGSALATH